MRFGQDFDLDLGAHRLTRAGRVVRLERIPTEILLLLVERRGQLVTRQQIVDRIWGPGVFLDTDNSINGAIRKIRQVLNDDAEEPRFVETITGWGYRFIAPIEVAEAESERTSAQPIAASAAAPVSVVPSGKPPSRRGPLLLAILVVVTAAAGTWLLWFRSPAHLPPPAGRVMLAVLPFENLTGDAGQDYFSDGLTEELISRLGNLDPQRLGVIARTSVMRYNRGQIRPDQMARELGVQYLLEGSVRRDSKRIRITAQLVQVSDQTQLWARQFDRDLSSLLAVQAEIAQAVANEIQLTLADTGGTGAVPSGALSSSEYEAYDLYLKGRYFWNRRTPEGFQQAVEHFEQAAAKDPTYARAYAGMADSYALMSSYSVAPATELIPKARSAALRALELDDRLAEAHTSLALISQNYDWDWGNAEKEYQRAIQLNPNYATAHHWYAESLAFQGRFEEAFAESERARQLDPLSLIIAADHAAVLYFARQHERAIVQFRAVIATDPLFPRSHMIVYAYVEKGMFPEALADVREWHRHDDTLWPWVAEAYINGRMGRLPEARRAVAKLAEAKGQQGTDPVPMLAFAYAGMNDSDKAIAYLQEACLRHSNVLITLKVDPAYDRLRDDPRFQELLRRVGLAGQQ
jgi:TolB-like protein/DNA-binding winged helix-turn-helix (wHTH) protein/Tfp pilus assembly protein PilF